MPPYLYPQLKKEIWKAKKKVGWRQAPSEPRRKTRFPRLCRCQITQLSQSTQYDDIHNGIADDSYRTSTSASWPVESDGWSKFFKDVIYVHSHSSWLVLLIKMFRCGRMIRILYQHRSHRSIVSIEIFPIFPPMRCGCCRCLWSLCIILKITTIVFKCKYLYCNVCNVLCRVHYRVDREKVPQVLSRVFKDTETEHSETFAQECEYLNDKLFN